MIKLEIIKFVYPDISTIAIPLIILILTLIVIVAIMICIANKELKNKEEK